MSRIGKLPIVIPEKVQFNYTDSIVKVEGPKGKLERQIAFSGSIKIEDGKLIVLPGGEDKQSRAQHGLIRSLLSNMVVGVTEGFSRTLKIVGVGYKAQAQERALQLIRQGRDMAHRCDALLQRIANNECHAGVTVAQVLGARYYKRIGGHVLNVLSSVVMPLHKVDYYDEDELVEKEPVEEKPQAE